MRIKCPVDGGFCLPTYAARVGGDYLTDWRCSENRLHLFATNGRRVLIDGEVPEALVCRRK